MALIGNYSLINRTPFRQFANGVSSGYRETFTNGGSDQNRHFGGFSSISASPVGYLHPAAWILPKVAGGITSSYSAVVSISNGALARGVNVTSNPSASISLTNGEFAAIVNILSSFSASGSFTNAEINQLQNISASISASASITDAQIETLAVILLGASINGSISITNGALGAIIDLSSASSGALTGGAIVNILVNISADIGGPTPLSPEGLANAVWDTVLVDHQVAGSTGKALSDSGSAGNPWSADLASNNTSGTFGALVQKLLTLSKYLGLR